MMTCGIGLSVNTNVTTAKLCVEENDKDHKTHAVK